MRIIDQLHNYNYKSKKTNQNTKVDMKNLQVYISM